MKHLEQLKTDIKWKIKKLELEKNKYETQHWIIQRKEWRRMHRKDNKWILRIYQGK